MFARCGFLGALVASFLPLLTQTSMGEPPSVGPKEAAGGNEAARADVLGDPLPAEALARLGTVRFREVTPVAAAVFLRDGKESAEVGGPTQRIGTLGQPRSIRVRVVFPSGGSDDPY
jgi:hypothetical protein